MCIERPYFVGEISKKRIYRQKSAVVLTHLITLCVVCRLATRKCSWLCGTRPGRRTTTDCGRSPTPTPDVLLLCFAVDNPDSFQNVDEKWLSEISHFCPKVPRILVGTKKDLRNDECCMQRLAEQKLKPVTAEEGQMMAVKIQATAYIECSAKTREGVQDVFEVAAKAALQRRYRTKRSPQCKVL